jgi:hypothetical protein
MKLFVNETNNLRKNRRGAYKEASTSIYYYEKLFGVKFLGIIFLSYFGEL